MATINAYDKAITAGAASISPTGIASAATAFTVYDILGHTVATGTVGGTTTIAPTGGWQPGWYYIEFTGPWSGSTGYILDQLHLTVLRTGVAPLPPIPAATATPVASDPNGRGLDLYMHAIAQFGPERWEIHDAANPTVFTAGTEAGGIISAIQANIAQNQAAGGYNDPATIDPVRPRPEFVTFPYARMSETGYAAGIAQVVQALGPGTTYGVKYFQGLNEPQGSNGLSPAQSAAEFNAFRAAVKAANPNALVMGPAEVEFGPNGTSYSPHISDFVTWLGAITPGSLDVMDLHDYNGYNGDFLVTDVWLGDIRAALATAGYPATLPFWLTENSVDEQWSFYHPRRLVNWTAQLYLTAERWGIPKEQIYWFFDTSDGYEPGHGAPYLRETTGELRPQIVFFRVYSEEIFGKTYTSALTFGAIGDKLYRGNVYRGTAGTTVALTSAGNPSDTVTLNVSDAGTVTVVDWQGRTSTVPVVNGQITVTIHDLPVYLRLSAGCTVSVADVGNGLMAGTNVAPAATVTSSTGASNPGYVNDGNYRTGGYTTIGGNADTAYSASIGDALTLTWTTPQTLKKVVIRQLPPWLEVRCDAMTAGKLEWWTGHDWLPVPTVAKGHWDGAGNYNNTTAVSFLARVPSGAKRMTWWDYQWTFNVDFAATIVTTKLRWTVIASSYGELPDYNCLTYDSYLANDVFQQSSFCSQILAIEGTVTSDLSASESFII